MLAGLQHESMRNGTKWSIVKTHFASHNIFVHNMLCEFMGSPLLLLATNHAVSLVGSTPTRTSIVPTACRPTTSAFCEN